jgi:hypothetical protein
MTHTKDTQKQFQMGCKLPGESNAENNITNMRICGEIIWRKKKEKDKADLQ